MAIKALVTKALYDEMPEEIQGLYKESGDSYILDLDGVDDHPSVKGLKAKVDELLGETKAEREKRQAIEKAQAEADRKSAEERGEFEKLYKKTQDELDAQMKAAREFKQQIEQRDIKASALDIARSLAAKDAKRADVLADYASKYIKFEDGQIHYEIGGVKTDQSKVAEHLKAELPFLVDGTQANGGGAAGSGRATDSKQVTRSEFDAMSQSDRAAHAKSGGTVIND